MVLRIEFLHLFWHGNSHVKSMSLLSLQKMKQCLSRLRKNLLILYLSCRRIRLELKKRRFLHCALTLKTFIWLIHHYNVLVLRDLHQCMSSLQKPLL